MFNLTRYFSTLSFALIALAAGLLTFYFRHITYEQLLRHEQSRAEEFTQVFENSLWPHFKTDHGKCPGGCTGCVARTRSQCPAP